MYYKIRNFHAFRSSIEKDNDIFYFYYNYTIPIIKWIWFLYDDSKTNAKGKSN